MNAATTPTANDLALLRTAMTMAQDAVNNGNHPFGAILTDATGQVVATAQNTVVTGNDATGHAETNLARIASQTIDKAALASHTLFTSCEPCAMCSGAIYWAGIGRVVYALAETSLLELTGSHPDNPTLELPCRTVFAGGQRPTEVVGPALENEAAAPHRSFWR